MAVGGPHIQDLHTKLFIFPASSVVGLPGLRHLDAEFDSRFKATSSVAQGGRRHC